jgi:error-prone DNA polymerase
LAEAGAFQSLGIARRDALWAARRPPTTPLFVAAENRQNGYRVNLPKLGPKGTLRFDFATKGLCLDSHPLEHLRRQLRTRGVVTANQLPRYHRGQELSVAGMVMCRQKPMTASGVLFLTLEDETGVINLIVRPEIEAEYAMLLRQASLLLAWGRLERTYPQHAGDVPVIHLLPTAFERLDHGSGELSGMSRDFH